LYYRTGEDQPFNKIVRTNWRDVFRVVAYNYNTPYEHDAFVLSNLESNTNELILYDLAKNKTIEKVYNNPTFDVSGVSTSRKRDYEVDYFYYIGEKTVIIPVSDYFKKLNSRLKSHFGEKVFSIIDNTDDEDKYLILVETDKIYGTYYTYDVQSDKITKMLDLMPQLEEEDMAEMRPIQYTTRDGLRIYGYLTIPNNIKKGQKVPLIINPHGGPHGFRDYWGFNPETQLFASRGWKRFLVKRKQPDR